MSLDHQAKLKRIEDCRSLYLKYKGKRHELIERDMRALGHTNCYRRSLYNRFERERCTLGWIERFGWQNEEDAERERRGGAGISVSASRRPAVPASSSVPGSAGALACMDAKASRRNADPH